MQILKMKNYIIFVLYYGKRHSGGNYICYSISRGGDYTIMSSHNLHVSKRKALKKKPTKLSGKFDICIYLSYCTVLYISKIRLPCIK